jgi:hypothetical protein
MYFVYTPAVVALCARLYTLSLLNSDDNDDNDKRCSPIVILSETKDLLDADKRQNDNNDKQNALSLNKIFRICLLVSLSLHDNAPRLLLVSLVTLVSRVFPKQKKRSA